MKITKTFFRYFAYSLEILIFYILQSTPKLLPELFGSKPLILIAIALTIAAKENEIPSLIFGAVCGVLTDIATGGSIGYFAIILTLVCYFESHIFKTYFVSTLLSVLVISALSIPAIICLYFLFFTILAGIPDWTVLFVNHYISRIIYTFATVILFYFVNGFLHKNLHD